MSHVKIKLEVLLCEGQGYYQRFQLHRVRGYFGISGQRKLVQAVLRYSLQQSAGIHEAVSKRDEKKTQEVLES